MKHFTLGDWADFARHLTTPQVRAQMQQHLDEGCEKCSSVFRIWRVLLDFASKEKWYSPPDRALRSVKGYYGLLKPDRKVSRVATMARLVFDSLFEAAPSGIRSSQPSPRQLVYSAGNLSIDFRIERRLGRIHLVGQAQHTVARGPGLAGTDVFVLNGAEMVAETKCNPFGEFQFELESEGVEGVAVVLKGPSPIVVPLPDI